MSKRKRNKVLEEFIEIYKSEPCLWRVKSKEYRNQMKRKSAYAKLVQKLKELESDANNETVVKKINNLRSNVRKEKKKYEASLNSGASEDDVYVPSLWYFNLFNFLDDQDNIGRSNSSIKGEGSDWEENFVNEQESLLNAVEGSWQNAKNESAENNNQRSTERTEQRSTGQSADENIANQPQFSKPGKMKSDQITTDVLLSAEDRLKRRLVQDDRYDLMGKCIAMKLRDLEKHQCLIAEKLINDILFEAEMGNLTTQSYQNTPGYVQQYQPADSRYSQNSMFIPSPNPSLTSCTQSPNR